MRSEFNRVAGGFSPPAPPPPSMRCDTTKGRKGDIVQNLLDDLTGLEGLGPLFGFTVSK